MIDFLFRSRPAAAALVLSFALVACDGGDDAGGDDFNEETAGEMASIADELSNATASSEQVQANLTNAFFASPIGGGVPLSPLLPFEVMKGMRAATLGDVASVRRAAAIASPGAPSGVLLPDEIEGITFVWDETDSLYVASDRVGAPDNGARFVFYAVNPFTGYPTVPLNEVGYMDLVDESTEDVARLEVFVRDEDSDRTLADYFLRGEVDSTATSSTLTLRTEGYYADASDRLDFDMQMVFSGSEGSDENELHTNVELSTDAGSITLDHDAVQTEADYEATAEFVIEGDGNEAAFGFEVLGEDELNATVEGALTWNGDEVVLISGNVDNPEFSDPDGGNLTANQIEAVATMWYAFSAVYAYTSLTLIPFLFLMAISGF